jgi:hypothetical protein
MFNVIILIAADLLPIFLGKMHINSLANLSRIAYPGSKQMAIDELNDFAEHGRSWLHIR